MFFSGTLQEGISTALQQSKLVACFVTDDQEESKTWETEYLTDESIAPSLEKEAVVLRLAAGSEEAGYLAAIFPLPKIPTVVVIRNGQLKEYVAAGTEKAEFVRRIAGALSGAQPEAQGPEGVETGAIPLAQTETPAAAAAAAVAQPSANQTATNETSMESTSSSSSGQATPGTSSSDHASIEGELRRQAARKEREQIEKEKAQRRKEKGKMPETGSNETPSKAKHNESVRKASEQLAERQRQAREERARVLKLIADDRAERKAREEMRKQEREAERRREAGGEEVSAPPSTTQQQEAAASRGSTAPSSSVQRRHDQCAIQVRLFDGSTIRTRFPAQATLTNEVRQWIDEKRTDGNDPYTFKVILTPLPNRAIDHATEEDKTLAELGLSPSSTLVLTPMDRRYATAYTNTNMNAGLGNPVSRLITAVLAFVVSVLGGITGVLGGGAGATRGDDQGDASGHELDSLSSSQAQATGRDGGGRIQGFHNPDDRRKDYQLYNGNSVSASTY